MARVSPSKQNQSGKTTEYWAAQIAQYEAENPNAKGVPPNLKESYKQAFDREPEGTRTPITWKGREAHLESHGTRTQKPGADKWKLVYQKTRDIKSTTRRAAGQDKLITLKERQNWYKRNLYPDWKIKAAEDFAKDAKDRADLKARIRQANKSLPKGKKLIYEHLAPLRVEEGRAGGFESARNVVAAPEKPNIEKSDKVASTEVLRQQQVPVTRSGAIRADARRTPIQGTDAERFDAVFQDIKEQNRPSARSLPPIEEVRRKNLAKRLGVLGIGLAGYEVAQQVKAGDFKGAAGTVGHFAADEAFGHIPVIGDMLSPESTAYGTLDEPQRVAQRQQQLEAEREWAVNTLKSIGTSVRDLLFLR